MKLLKLNLILCLLFSLSLSAQTDSVITGLHPDLQTLSDSYLELLDSNGFPLDSTLLRSIKKKRRNLQFWSKRAGAGFAAYGQSVLNNWQNNEMCQLNDGYLNNENTKWNNLRINTQPADESHFAYAGGSGAMHSHWVNPLNPQEIFIGASSGGLWKTTDGGTTWNNLTDNDNLPNFGIGVISVDPNNTNNILIAMRHERYENNLNIGVFRTTNGGTSWNLVSSIYTPSDIHGIMDIKRNPDDSEKVIAISKTRVYKSNDGGGTFTLSTTLAGELDPVTSLLCSSDLRRIYFNPYNTNDVYIIGKSLYYSSNAGVSFGSRTWALPVNCGNIKSVNVDIAEDATNTLVLSLIAKVGNTTVGNIYSSADKGLSWTIIGDSYIRGINSFVAINDNLVFTGGVRMVKISLDPYQAFNVGTGLKGGYGINYYHDDIRSLSKVKIGNNWHLYAGTDGGLYKSTDLGLTWVHLNPSIDLSEIYDFDTQSRTKYLVTGTQDMGMSIYNKRSSTWYPSVQRGDFVQSVFNLADDPVCTTTEYYNSPKFYKVNDNDITQLGNGEYAQFIGPAGGANYTARDVDYKTKSNIYTGHTNLVNYKVDDHTYTHITSYPELSGQTFRANCISIGNANSNPNVLYSGWYNVGGWHGMARQPNLFRGVKDESGNWTWANISPYGTPQNPGTLGIWVVPRVICISPDDENTLMVGMDFMSLSGDNNPRVIYTTDGGQTWEDKSYGLPMNFGINDIVFQKGTNNTYYAATDIGVYYYDPNFQENGHVGKWRCYNYGLPNVMVSDLKIDYCSSTLYASTFGRGMWEIPLIQNTAQDLVVSNDQTWDYYKEMGGDLRITNGAVLTITGDLIMQENKRIHVEPGAELRVIGGKITSACNDKPWYGILAEGTTNQHQSPGGHPTYQALIYLKDATIENAKNAITTAKMDNNYNIVWGHSGAVIRAVNTHFKNNRRSVAYFSYQNFNPNTNKPRSNYGRFIECQFTTDQDYVLNSPYDHNVQVSAWEVRGVTFSACEFEMPFNTSATDGVIESRAIYALDASLKILPKCTSSPNQYPCNQYKRSSFEGYDIAIDIDNTSSLYPIEVDRADFLNNYHAISLNRAHYSRITRCDIDNTINYDGYTGINLYNTIGFSVEENHIKTQSGNITGIRAKDLYTNNILQDDIIYNNKIANARIGIEFKGLTGLATWAGLTAECNDFGANVSGGYTDNDYDIRINPETLTKTIWGENNDPMENYFSQTNTNTERNIKIAAASSYSNLHTYIWNTNEVETNPNDITLSIGKQSFLTGNRNCPSLLNSYYQKPPMVLRTERNLGKTSFNTLYTNYNAILNGGINQNILEDLWDIANVNNDALIQILIDNSPYLSDEVLVEAIHYPHISDWDLTQILVWNGPLTPQVKEEVNQSGRFTATYLNLILGRTGVSQRFLLDQQLAQKVHEYSIAGNHYYQRVLLDSNLTVFDTADVFVDSMDLTVGSYDNQHALDWYIATEQYGKAQSFLANHSIDLPSDALSHFKDFKRLSTHLTAQGGNWFTMGERQIDSLTLLGNDSSKADFQLAQNVLEFLNIQRFAEPTSDPDVSVRRARPIIKPEPLTIERFKVWPNPVTDQLKILWTLDNNTENLRIELINVLGKTVYQNKVSVQDALINLDCSAYTSGTYILRIHHSEGVYQDKVEITH